MLKAISVLFLIASGQCLLPIPSLAKEVFLSCDGDRLVIDFNKETFAYAVGDKIYKGAAEIFPDQVKYVYQVARPPGTMPGRYKDAFRYSWVVNRETLAYTKSFQTGHTIFKGQISWVGAGTSYTGKCELISSPQRLI